MQPLIDYLAHHPYLAGAGLFALFTVAVYELQARGATFASLSATQAVRLMNQGALVVDLRGKEPYDAGHIGDARHIPAATLESQADTLKKWREKDVITYCDTGREAAIAVRTLSKLGFTKVFSLEGGLNAWIKNNMPVTKSSTGGKQNAA
jgi:rhodanese-related sulfurtransferase